MSDNTSEITVDELAAAVQQGATVVDVREPSEYVRGHVPGAVLMPMGQLPSRVDELDIEQPGLRGVRLGKPQRLDDRLPRQRRLRRLLRGRRHVWVGPVRTRRRHRHRPRRLSTRLAPLALDRPGRTP